MCGACASTASKTQTTSTPTRMVTYPGPQFRTSPRTALDLVTGAAPAGVEDDEWQRGI